MRSGETPKPRSNPLMSVEAQLARLIDDYPAAFLLYDELAVQRTAEPELTARPEAALAGPVGFLLLSRGGR